MPLIIPPSGSNTIQPFLQSVASRLGEYYGLLNLFSREPRPHKQEVRDIVLAIRAGDLDMANLLQRLRMAPLVNDPVIVRYTGEIIDGLMRYLSQVDAYGYNALMRVTHNNPDAVDSILAAMNGLSSEQKVEILTKTDRHDGKNALMFAVRNNPAAVGPVLEAMNGLSPE